MRQTWPALVVVGVLVLATACVGGPGSTGAADASLSPSEPSTADPGSDGPSQAVEPTASLRAVGLHDELVTPGRLLVCSEFPSPRFREYDADGQPVGVDVEIGEELAMRLGLEVEFHDLVFEEIIDSLLASECDLAIAGHFITEERQQLMEMIPYRQGTQPVLVAEGNPEGITALVDLCGKTVATRRGTIQVDFVVGAGMFTDAGLDQLCEGRGEPAVELLTFTQDEDALGAVTTTGEAVAYLGSPFWLDEFPDLLDVSDATLPPLVNGIGVAKADPVLRDAVQAALDQMIADGTYDEILRKWNVAHIAIEQ